MPKSESLHIMPLALHHSPDRKRTCFISYAWEEDHNYPHLTFSKKLCDDLVRGGIDARIDVSDLLAGDDIKRFIWQHIRYGDFVILILTPTLINRARDANAWIYKEVRLIGERLKYNDAFYIPLLKEGSDSLPGDIRTILNDSSEERLYKDFRREEDYSRCVKELTEEILKKSIIKTEITIYLSNLPEEANQDPCFAEVSKAVLRKDIQNYWSIYYGMFGCIAGTTSLIAFNTIFEVILSAYYGWNTSIVASYEDNYFKGLAQTCSQSPAFLCGVIGAYYGWNYGKNPLSKLGFVIGGAIGFGIIGYYLSDFFAFNFYPHSLETSILAATTCAASIIGASFGIHQGIMKGRMHDIADANRFVADQRNIEWIQKPYIDIAVRTSQNEQMLYNLTARLRPKSLGWKNRETDQDKKCDSVVQVGWSISGSLLNDEDIIEQYKDTSFLKISNKGLHIPYDQIKQNALFSGSFSRILPLNELLVIICQQVYKSKQCSWSGKIVSVNRKATESSPLLPHYVKQTIREEEVVSPSIFTCRLLGQLLDKLLIQSNDLMTQISPFKEFIIPYTQKDEAQVLIISNLLANHRRLCLEPNTDLIQKVLGKSQNSN